MCKAFVARGMNKDSIAQLHKYTPLHCTLYSAHNQATVLSHLCREVFEGGGQARLSDDVVLHQVAARGSEGCRRQ